MPRTGSKGWKLRKLGLIGGLSWVSTAMYYEQINKGVIRRKGPLASPPLLIDSLDFESFSAMQVSGDWDGVGDVLSGSAKRLETAGAEGLILCSNTAHKVHDRVAAAVGIPIIHIGDVTAAKLVKDGVKRTGLIGTRFTMTDSFYRDRIEAHGIAVTVPTPTPPARSTASSSRNWCAAPCRGCPAGRSRPASPSWARHASRR
jgi:aspartate racemase